MISYHAPRPPFNRECRFPDPTERVAAGALCPTTPARPSGSNKTALYATPDAAHHGATSACAALCAHSARGHTVSPRKCPTGIRELIPARRAREAVRERASPSHTAPPGVQPAPPQWRKTLGRPLGLRRAVRTRTRPPTALSATRCPHKNAIGRMPTHAARGVTSGECVLCARGLPVRRDIACGGKVRGPAASAGELGDRAGGTITSVPVPIAVTVESRGTKCGRVLEFAGNGLLPGRTTCRTASRASLGRTPSPQYCGRSPVFCV